jgi:spore coat protein U-like protein
MTRSNLPQSGPHCRIRRRGALLLAGATFAVSLAGALPAFAATSPGATMAVSSTVVATCLNTVTAMTFPAYTGVVEASTATVSITCTNTTPYNVSLDAGASTGATTATRAMTGPGGALLHYVLTSDAAYAVNWGMIVATDTIAGIGTGAAQPITIYGQEAAGQYVAPGTYNDTVTATVTY